MINFVIVSLDMHPYLLDTKVKREADPSNDYHLVVNWIWCWGGCRT